MKRYVLLLAVLVIVIPVTGNAYAFWPFPDESKIEHGRNYDREEISPNVFQLTTKPDRMLIGNTWTDFRYQDRPTSFTFESANGAVTISKTDCAIRIMDPGTVQSGEVAVINSISQVVKEAHNGTDLWSLHPANDKACEFSYSTNDHGVQAVLTKQDMLLGMGTKFDTIYDIDYSGKIKTTFRYQNNDPAKTDHKYGFTQVFSGNFDVMIGDDHYTTNDQATITKEQMTGKIITIANNGIEIAYDPENYIHDYLWAVKIENGKLILDFTYSKGALPVGQALEIDPVFGYTAANNEQRVRSTTAASVSCDNAPYIKDTTTLTAPYKGNSAAVDNCSVRFFQWGISAIPDNAVVTDVKIRVDITAVTNPTKCDYVQTTSDISTETAANLWTQGTTGTVYVDDSMVCYTVANDQIVDLGTTADSYLQSLLPSDRFAIAARLQNMTRDTVSHYSEFDGFTQDLQVTYTVPPVMYELKPFQSDGTTVIGSGNVYKKNATNTETLLINSTGWAKSADVSATASYNYTIKDALDGFVNNQTINKILAENQAQSGTTNIFPVDCGAADTDFQVKPNFTSYHTMTSTTPTCSADGDITFTTTDTARGLGPSTNQTRNVIARIIDTAEYNWLPGKMTANGTAITGTYLTNVVNFTGVQIGNGYKNFVMDFVIFTDNVTSQPTALSATPASETQVNLSWTAPSELHGDVIQSYRVWRDGAIIQNSTGSVATTYSDTLAGPGGSSHTYQVCAWNRIGCSPYSATASAVTYTATTGTISLVSGNIGDTVNVNATITITAGSPTPFTIQDVRLYDNNTLVYTNTTDITVSSVGDTALSRIWYQITNDDLNIFHVQTTVTNSSGTVNLSSANNNVTREYAPIYVAALENPSTEGFVNYTVSRFDNEDGILLHVNREGGTLGTVWEIDCITQTNAQARATVNQSSTWPGTWINRTGTGYFNGTWTDFRNTQGYVTCINPPGILFTTTSYTNSSLALFGIEIFDESYGSMLGVPVGIFFLALAGGMASKRTAPTWIVVLCAMAGVMATIGFFTITPIVWGLALVTALLGLLVNSKVF